MITLLILFAFFVTVRYWHMVSSGWYSESEKNTYIFFFLFFLNSRQKIYYVILLIKSKKRYRDDRRMIKEKKRRILTFSNCWVLPFLSSLHKKIALKINTQV
jgi:hypothetical protein